MMLDCLITPMFVLTDRFKERNPDPFEGTQDTLAFPPQGVEPRLTP